MPLSKVDLRYRPQDIKLSVVLDDYRRAINNIVDTVNLIDGNVEDISSSTIDVLDSLNEAYFARDGKIYIKHQYSAGTGLTGGGTLDEDRTFALSHLGIESLTDPGADRPLFWDESANATAWLTVSTGLQIVTTNLTTKDSEIVHDNLSGFVADEHIAHSGVSISAGTGLTGGGTIEATRTLSLSHLGIEALADPNADQLLGWDDSDGVMKFISIGAGLTYDHALHTLATSFGGDHGTLTGLSDDDHTQYLLASGARALAGNWALGGFNLTGGGTIYSDYYALGTNPADSGRIRIPNNALINARNFANDANIILMYADTSNRVEIADSLLIVTSASHATPGCIIAGADVAVVGCTLQVEGRMAMKETTAPTLTAGYGKVYVKSSDSLIYFMDDSGAEFNLTTGGGGAGAPANAQYIVGTANASLSAEKVKAYLYNNYDPDDTPTSPNALDDEFDDSSLNVKWTLVNDPGFTESTYTGFLWTIDMDGVASASLFSNMARLYQTPPTGSTTWKIAAKVCVASIEDALNVYQGAGVYLADTAPANDTFVGVSIQVSTASTSGRMNVQPQMDDGAGALTGMSTVNVLYVDQTSWVYVMLEKATANAYTSANTYNAYFSLNGIIWTSTGTCSKTFANIPDQIGLWFRKPDTAGNHGMALCDWFRRTA